jgi:hypothetical protein
MTTQIFTTILLVCLALTSYGQEINKKTNPVYQYGQIRLTVREAPPQLIAKGPNDLIEINDTVKWKNIKYFDLEKLDNKSNWIPANSFTESQLVELKIAIEKAIKEEKIQTFEKQN